jgi:hypothetical protein
MALARNIFFLFSVMILSAVSLIMTIYNNNPFQADKSVFIGFYVSFFITVMSVLAILLIGIKVRFTKDAAVNALFWPSIRQGSLVALALTTMLFLRSFDILDWLISLSLIVVFVLMELFFQTKLRRAK